MRFFELKESEYMTEDLYIEKGTKMPLSPYVDERIMQMNETKGWTPVLIREATSLTTGQPEKLDIQTYWFSTNNLKEVN